MIIFNTDLDNTLIYSYKHDIGQNKINVEMYQGREISYITEYTYNMLREIRDRVLIVPTTTRTQEQYERIDLGLGSIKYALVCNGGILLVDGIRQKDWTKESYEIIENSRDELLKSVNILESDNRRKFEVRFIEEMFVFTKCDEPESVVEDLKNILDGTLVDVFNNGEKIYVVPKKLNKGTAVQRFKKYIGAEKLIAAGDSEFDIPMVAKADIGIVPAGFRDKYIMDDKLVQMTGEKVFSEELLEYILKVINKEVVG